MYDQFHQAEEQHFWQTQIFALHEEGKFRGIAAIEGFRFRLAELSILAATATTALVAIRSGETGPGNFFSVVTAVAFLLACLAEITLVWRAAAGDEKRQIWGWWDAIGAAIFVAGLLLAIAGVVLLCF
jgi:hypothetical protein